VMESGTLDGRTTVAIESRGKHLLMHFDDHRVLHSHMGMTGSWHIYRPHDRWQKPERFAFITIRNADWVVVCFTPKLLQLLSSQELKRDAYLQRLGPDVLGPPIPDPVLLSRFRVHDAVTIGEAMMNQTIICGIGNIYKSEILFLEHLHPLTRVHQLSDEQLLRIRDRAVNLMGRNIHSDERRIRIRGDGFNFHAYGRSGEPCFVCGEKIQLIRQGDLGRTTCFCPTCQPAPIQ
ncbi:MAG: hypothetical protein KDA85_03165, partial [Planctomycetaceae bacterium]|nr:hypothetical protein [Planctomycetaceae bacterium]